MRFDFDRAKNRLVKQKHGISLSEAREIFDQAYLVIRKVMTHGSFRAIGWCHGRLCSVIFEIRHDDVGDRVTAWKATKQEHQSYAENV